MPQPMVEKISLSLDSRNFGSDSFDYRGPDLKGLHLLECQPACQMVGHQQ